jgi:hypothetical protein
LRVGVKIEELFTNDGRRGGDDDAGVDGRRHGGSMVWEED